MNNFTISQLEQYSGIKAHTIRVWERRYNALSPDRSEGNTRYYDDIQLRRLLNIVSLTGSEYKMSELCGFSDNQLFQLLVKRLESPALPNTDEYYVSQLIAAGLAYNEHGFKKIFSNCVLRLGLSDSYRRVIYPMMLRTGLMWGADIMPPGAEHFMSNLVRQKLFSAIDALPPAQSSKETWLLFLPENELHETGLLFSYYLLKNAGKKVIYLGANVPESTIIQSIKYSKATHVLFFMVHQQSEETNEKYLQYISKACKGLHVCFASGDSMPLPPSLPENIKRLFSVDDLIKQII